MGEHFPQEQNAGAEGKDSDPASVAVGRKGHLPTVQTRRRAPAASKVLLHLTGMRGFCLLEEIPQHGECG